MKCPVCRTVYRPVKVNQDQDILFSSSLPSPLCRRCGVDLSPLIHLYDQSLWHYRRALQLVALRDYEAARQSNEQALALHYANPDFHALAGQLWALQGDCQEAIASWGLALSLDPKHPIAQSCQHQVAELKRSSDVIRRNET